MPTFDEIMRPVWEGGVVHDESVAFVGDEPAPLLFEPSEILRVQNAALTETYEHGADWTLTEGRLCLTPDSRICRFGTAELLAAEPADDTFPRVGGGYVRYAEGHHFHDRQVAVSYRCAPGRWTGPRPSSVMDSLPRTARRLAQGGLRLVILGDSIAAGYNASGFTGAPPFQPPWADLLAEQLRRHYGAAIDLTNVSVAGMDAQWGHDNAAGLVNQLQPDLVVVAFGMNDQVAGEQFRESIAAIRDAIRDGVPDAEFLLIATSLPNPEVVLSARFQHEYAAALAPLVGDGVALADIGGLHRHLLTRKRFLDMTGNNINHPNDFFHRLHAQYLSAVLGAGSASDGAGQGAEAGSATDAISAH